MRDLALVLAFFKRANEVLEDRGRVPLPKGLTPHKLHHTFASVLIACSEDPSNRSLASTSSRSSLAQPPNTIPASL